MWSCRGPEGTKSAVSREVFLGPVVCPLTMAHKVWRIGFDQVCEVLPGNALPHTTQGVQPKWCTAKLGLLPGRHDAWP
jgi:hypothetical protein